MGRRNRWRAAVLAATALLVIASGANRASAATFSTEEIEQLVAPIALYPDALLSQVLMASTYPLEVVEAGRWAEKNPNVTGKALEDAMQQQSWDESVKSLTAFPDVLTMMNEKLDWTQKLGDAFLAQQDDVMNATQRLRAKAKDEGNLETTEQQTVTVEPAATSTTTQTIIIEPADPQVVYVPSYNPTVVYGTWPYPAYPPYYYYPPGYVAGSALWFGAGLAVGGALWGGCNWGNNDVDIDINRYNEFNKTDIRNNKWEHKPEHRKGVQYRDKASQDRFGHGQRKGAQSREQFRGRAEQGQRELAHGGTDRVRKDLERSGGARRDTGRSGDRRQAAQRSQQRQPSQRNTQRQTAQRSNRQSQQRASGGRSGAFGGSSYGRQARQHSSRGHASRSRAHGGGARRGGGGRRR